jgi:hypothetical protein
MTINDGLQDYTWILSRMSIERAQDGNSYPRY